MIHQITSTLQRIENTRDVRILFAVESGSRAWGFESKDSDYDVRYVYIHPAATYLSVMPFRDVIENGDVGRLEPLLDFSGWDLRKFLQLIAKSNPVAFEWLQSPVVYFESERWHQVEHAVRPFFSAKRAMHHYLSMARHNYREHMRDGTSSHVRLKKYLYITRPLLCCRWMEASPNAGPPPMEFEEVMAGAGIDQNLAAELRALVERKRAGDELDEGAANPRINQFIDTELWRLRLVADAASPGAGRPEDLDRLFYSHVST